MYVKVQGKYWIRGASVVLHAPIIYLHIAQINIDFMVKLGVRGFLVKMKYSDQFWYLPKAL